MTIGKGSVIGGNVWLTRSVPSNSRIAQQSPKQEFFQGRWGDLSSGSSGNAVVCVGTRGCFFHARRRSIDLLVGVLVALGDAVSFVAG